MRYTVGTLWHSDEDAFTARLVTDLQAAGADVWVDTSGIPSGSFVAKISEGLYNTALRLARENDMIYHEDLQMANMVKNHHLAKSIQDAGWSAFLSILAAKAAYAGRRVVAVPPAYTSQTCSGCGVIVSKGLFVRSKGLFVRWHSCPDCRTSLHRDHNAARNIESLGQWLRGAVA